MNEHAINPTPDREGTLRVGLLISGAGTTMVNLAENIRHRRTSAEIALVISSNPKAAGIERARQMHLPVNVVPRKQYDSVEAFSDRIFQLMRLAEVDLVVMAGFLSLVYIPADFRWRVMNIHPALLPAHGGQGMYGQRVHEAVLAAGDRETGCTVHFADNQYDHGPIILQRRCDVRDSDTPQTLHERVQAAERIAYPRAIQLFAEGRLVVEGDQVRILDEADV
jgi:formyltetrahydrofolate-dependent phosphoribosylglycinamide formyltransferase